ncbi:MAG: hypothetical protein E5W64_10290 [Mesorhizobium sp.]|uniref:LysE family translocator n=1 Tax=Mesorhizobium sp. TaxID=1871066 RepID=UPI00121F4D6F|nr:LysE family transporter [Mesorhizobium sp.]TIT35470.1 MAG: hypothetical protein E5W65_13270 [Mesorhizobium sp.]TIT52396.1 MAG: hypothetical protein E5W64_10290 [Mesorhizobium sp.]
MSIEFLLTSLIVVASPGTGVLYTLSAGLSRGARASIIAAFGCTLGIIPHMAAAITGLAALLHTSAVAFETLKYLIFAASIRSHVVSRPMVLTWMRRTFAGAFVMLGAKLALADR